MTLDELGKSIRGTKPGEHVAVNYDVFAALFPPGEWNTDARQASWVFATCAEAYVEDVPDLREMRFIKSADGT